MRRIAALALAPRGYWRASLASAMALATFPSAQAQSHTRTFGALQSTRMCRIQVTREGSSNANSLSLGATTAPSVHAVELHSQSRTNVMQSLVVTSGYPATLDVDGEAVQVRCLALPNSFELELTVASRPAAVPAPVVFPRPGEGSQPTRPLPRAPVEGPVKSLSTTISVQRSQRLEIGGTTRDLRKKNREISTGGVGYGKSDESGGESVYLVIE